MAPGKLPLEHVIQPRHREAGPPEDLREVEMFIRRLCPKISRRQPIIFFNPKTVYGPPQVLDEHGRCPRRALWLQARS